MSVSRNKARSRFGECLHLKVNKRGREIKTCSDAQAGAPLLIAKQLCYLSGDIFKRGKEKAQRGDGKKRLEERRRRSEEEVRMI